MNKILEAYNKGLLQERSNQIRTTFNGSECTIRIYVENGNILYFNAFPGTTPRQIGNTFNL